jgi:hypothetical protein
VKSNKVARAFRRGKPSVSVASNGFAFETSKEFKELWLKSNKVARAFRRGKPSVNVAFSALPKSVLK